MKCDVRKEEDILSMMSAIKSQFGGADICVNNAGLGYDAPLLSGTTEKWKIMLDVSMCKVVFVVIGHKVQNFKGFVTPLKSCTASVGGGHQQLGTLSEKSIL